MINIRYLLTKDRKFLTDFIRSRRFSVSIIKMASAATSYNVYIPNDVTPTAQTKIKLADNILVSPLGKFGNLAIVSHMLYPIESSLK